MGKIYYKMNGDLVVGFMEQEGEGCFPLKDEQYNDWRDKFRFCQCLGKELRAADGWIVMQDKTRPPMTLEQVCRERRIAYQREADGLFFDWQRGAGTKENWEARVAEIKLRYPKPIEP